MRRLGTAALFAALAAASACEDLRHFEGSWAGTVSPDPRQRHGFAAGAALEARVTTANRAALAMTLTLPGAAAAVEFVPMRHAAGDALGDLSIPGDPLRSYLGFVTPTGAAPYLAVVSLFPEERIEVRLIRGPEESYGVFSLRPRR